MPSFGAQIEAIEAKYVRMLDQIWQDSLFDLLELCQTPQPSVEQTGGPFEIGKIPVLSSDLIRSLATQLNGQGWSVPDELAYNFTISLSRAGDTIRFWWTAKHAVPIEVGWETSTGRLVGGRQFVSANAAKWADIVDTNRRRLLG